ncbi:MAG: hypothetical protein EAX86_12355 [Candidatus Heimdallarchaeota archaeon]|nr:hypothetical protein [Candidatus Heimdallarchaeota archaeon]
MIRRAKSCVTFTIFLLLLQISPFLANSINTTIYHPLDSLPFSIQLTNISWTITAKTSETEFNFQTEIKIENLADENVTVTFSDSGEFIIYITADFLNSSYSLAGPNIGFLQVITNRTYTPGITSRSQSFPFTINSSNLSSLPNGIYYIRIGTSHPEFSSNQTKKLPFPNYGATITISETTTEIDYEYDNTDPKATSWTFIVILETLCIIGGIKKFQKKKT